MLLHYGIERHSVDSYMKWCGYLLLLLVFLPSGSIASDFSGRFVAVLDGDTIEVLHNRRAERIRLAGIDCQGCYILVLFEVGRYHELCLGMVFDNQDGFLHGLTFSAYVETEMPSEAGILLLHLQQDRLHSGKLRAQCGQSVTDMV